MLRHCYSRAEPAATCYFTSSFCYVAWSKVESYDNNLDNFELSAVVNVSKQSFWLPIEQKQWTASYMRSGGDRV